MTKRLLSPNDINRRFRIHSERNVFFCIFFCQIIKVYHGQQQQQKQQQCTAQSFPRIVCSENIRNSETEISIILALKL